MPRWYFGRIREQPIGPFDGGERIVIGESTLKFSRPDMGKGWWILSLYHNKALLVADGHPSMGKGLRRIVRREEVVPPEKQERCTERAKSLLPDSAYTPKNRKRHTYFFGGRPTKNVETEWRYE
jgi:hypothetical protein